MAMWIPFLTISNTSVTRNPAFSATASPGSRYTVRPYLSCILLMQRSSLGIS